MLNRPEGLHGLGHTRSALRADHLLQTPDTFVRAALPGMMRGTAVVHVGPAAGAGFVQYTAEMESGGTLGPAVGQRFLYVLDGQVKVEGGGEARALGVGQYGYLPAAATSGARTTADPFGMTTERTAHATWTVRATEASRVAVIEKEFVAAEGLPAVEAFFGSEPEVVGNALDGNEDLEVKVLIPDAAGVDFAVNTMRYEPGAALSMVEVHVMEHGLLMLEGGGIYRLGDSWYPVTAGDFIWMAPYCPQWFGALGKTAAKYLIYKDWNRHPLAVVR